MDKRKKLLWLITISLLILTLFIGASQKTHAEEKEGYYSNSGTEIKQEGGVGITNFDGGQYSYIGVFLGKGGKKRYLYMTPYVGGTGQATPVYKVDNGNGNWVTLPNGFDSLMKITDDSNLEKDKKTFKDTYGYEYNDKDSILGSSSSNSNSSSSSKTPTYKDDEDALTNYYDNYRLGKYNTPANLLQSVIMGDGGKSGIKSKSISYTSLSQYPKYESVKQNVTDDDGKTEERMVGTAEYGNIKDSGGTTKVGATTSNMIKVVSQYGWLTTKKDDEQDTPWYQTIWDSMNSPVSAIVAIIAIVLGVVAEWVTALFKLLLEIAANVIGLLFPDYVLGLASEVMTGKTLSENGQWLYKIFENVITAVVGNNQKTLIKLIGNLSIAVWISIAVITFILSWLKGGVKGGVQKFIRGFFHVTAILMFFLLIPSINSSLKYDSVSPDEKAPTVDDGAFNSLKWAVGTNLDISYLYPDTYQNVVSETVKSKSALDESFKVTNETIAKANEAVNQKLGSQMSAQIDESVKGKNGQQSQFENIMNSDKTWNVNTYLRFISTSGTADAGGVNLASSYLPPLMSWADNVTNRYSVSAGSVSGIGTKNMDDVQKGGTFSWTGRPIFFNSLSDENEDGGDEEAYVAVNSLYGIKYDPQLFKPVVVSQSEPYTYLYGASTSNSYTTSNVANYTNYKGLSFNKDLTIRVNNNTQVDDDESTIPAGKDDTGSVKTKDTLPEGDGKDHRSRAQLQWQNAYMIAMYNKYAGTTTTSQKNFYNSGFGKFGFATQSTMFLLQSTYDSSGLDYLGYNPNFSNADKGKVQTSSNVYMPVYTFPMTATQMTNKVSTTAFGLIAVAIVYVGMVMAIYKYGFRDFIGDSWKAVVRVFTKGSFASVGILFLAKLAYKIIFSMSDKYESVMMYVLNAFMNGVTSSNWAQAWGMGVSGLILVLFSFFMVKPMFRVGNGKESLSSLFIYFVVLGYDAIVGILQRIDSIIYDENLATEGAGNRGSDKDIVDQLKLNRMTDHMNRLKNRGVTPSMNDSQSGDMDGTEDNSDGSSGGGSTPSSNGSGSGESGTQFKDKESTPSRTPSQNSFKQATKRVGGKVGKTALKYGKYVPYVGWVAGATETALKLKQGGKFKGAVDKLKDVRSKAKTNYTPRTNDKVNKQTSGNDLSKETRGRLETMMKGTEQKQVANSSSKRTPSQNPRTPTVNPRTPTVNPRTPTVNVQETVAKREAPKYTQRVSKHKPTKSTLQKKNRK